MNPLVLTALLLSAPLQAAPPLAPAAETRCFDLHCLEPEEMTIYEAAEAEIGRTLPWSGEPSELPAVVQDLFDRIDGLPLPEPARDYLRMTAGNLALADQDPGSAAFYALLESGDPAVQSVALAGLFDEPEDDWLGNEKVVAALAELLDDPAADAFVSESVLWLFDYFEAFDLVADSAWELASDPSDPERAHRTARVFVTVLEDRELERVYRTSEGAIRRQAALVLASGLGGPRAGRILDDLHAMAIDEALPAWVRGEAIEAIGRSPERARNRAILLELLEPEHWFFGAQAQHFRVHSLAVVVFALRAVADDPEIRQVLTGLYPAVETLRSGEREYVEWTLDNALGRERPVFAGPVDPEGQRNQENP